MPHTTKEQIDSFHQFAVEQLGNGGAELSLPELYNLWRVEHPAVSERQDIDAAIAEGLADVRSGRTQPAAEVSKELRKKHNLPE